MKNQFLTTLAVILISSSAFAQEMVPPKKGAKIYVENKSIEISEGGEVTFDMYLLKSKAAKRASFANPRFLAPDGLDFYLKQDAQDPNHYSVIVKADDIKSGNYSITVAGKTSGTHTVTGSILSLTVNPGSVVASTEGK